MPCWKEWFCSVCEFSLFQSFLYHNENSWYVVPKPLKVASTSRTSCDPCGSSVVTEKQELVALNGRESVASPQQSLSTSTVVPVPELLWQER